MFLAFQYPQEFPGVSVLNFLRQTVEARTGQETSVLDLRKRMLRWMDRLNMDSSFGDRYLNEGFSGGEKKRNEILQMALLQPDFAVLDETDSGLDIDALKIVASGVQEVRSRPTRARACWRSRTTNASSTTSNPTTSTSSSTAGSSRAADSSWSSASSATATRAGRADRERSTPPPFAPTSRCSNARSTASR